VIVTVARHGDDFPIAVFMLIEGVLFMAEVFRDAGEVSM
jgi:hypothetical protein